jgi:4-amino-4-deoxy-L-arabinose transferase-like glycosyltransferase
MSLSIRQRWMYAGLAALLVLVSLATLRYRPLFNSDEGRYAEIPREMLQGGDWVIPHLNGLAYVEKPPLQYWATAASFAMFGLNEFSARVYGALAAFGTVALVWLLGTRLWGQEAGWRAAAVLSGMLIFVALGQVLTLDMSLTFYMTLSLVGFLLAQHAAEGSAPGGRSAAPRRWMLLAWTGAALGVLTKGLVAAAIPAAVLTLYSIAMRDFAPWRRLNVSWGLPLFLILTVPWHWLAALRLHDFLQFFIVHEHLARYLTPSADRQEAWWFFGAVFLAGSLPWTLPSLRVLVGGWRRHGGSLGKFRPGLFLWIWVVFVGVFFSLSDSKLMPYILPAMPPLAILIAALPAATLKRDFLFTAALTAIAGVALLFASFHWPELVAKSDRSAYFLPLPKLLREIAALLIATGAFVLAQGARDATRDATHSGIFLGAGWCLAWLLIVRGAALVAPIYSGIDLAAAFPANELDAPLYSVGTYDQTLSFYLRRTVTLVNFRGELDYGLKQAPDSEIADLDEFLRLWAAQTRAFAVMDMGTFKNLTERGVPMRELGQNVQRVLVARQ